MQPNSGSALLRVGILGGGQLGSMLARSIQKLGHHVAIYDSNRAAPALKQTDLAFVGAWDDSTKLRTFIDSCDLLTYEFENVETPMLRQLLEETRRPIVPSLDVLETSQNRLIEKRFLRSHDLPCAHFIQVDEIASLSAAVESMGYPCILKTTRFGYDGKGQWRIASAAAFDALLATLESEAPTLFPCTLEEELPLVTEASAIVCRSGEGDTAEEFVFPIVENMHEKHILAYSLLPARLPAEVTDAMTAIASALGRALHLKGILAVEFFLTTTPARHAAGRIVGDYHIYVNEIAPRPHNSGHVTMAACTMSQFDALARILCDAPLTPTRTLSPLAFCMGNLLGDLWPEGHAPLPLAPLRAHPAVVDLVLYGKPEAKAGRKMGHFVVAEKTPDGALHAAKRFHSLLQAQTPKHR
jgi:5-(carboxyamino)imidazole ribonucleotide synthase